MNLDKKLQREYPRITPTMEEALIQLAEMYSTHSDFLTHPDCKYPLAVKNALATLTARNTINLPKNSPKSEITLDDEEFSAEEVDIHQESTSLYQKLKVFMKNTDKMETSEKAQIFRTATALLEKLLTIKEKSSGIQKYEDFKALVMNTLDRYLTPVQITKFIEELEEIEK